MAYAFSIKSNFTGLFHVFVIIAWLCIKPIDGQCKGSLVKDCCSGYRWDENQKECVECLPGLYGVNCRETCRYPSYGESCQKKCSCEKEVCDPSTGCPVLQIDLDISVINGSIQSKNYDKRDDFGFEIVNFPWIDGDVPRCTSYACSPGRIGDDCEKTCRYPSYGRECQLQCNCEEINCSPYSGCAYDTTRNYTTGRNLVILYVTHGSGQSTELRRSNSEEPASLSFIKSPIFIGMFVTIALFLFLFVFIFGMKVSRVMYKISEPRKKRSNDQAAAVATDLTSLHSIDYQALEEGTAEQRDRMVRVPDPMPRTIQIPPRTLISNIVENGYEDADNFSICVHQYQNTQDQEMESWVKIEKRATRQPSPVRNSSSEFLEEILESAPCPRICSGADALQNSTGHSYLVVLSDDNL